MTPEERQAKVNHTRAVQALAQAIIHDLGMRPDVRQEARDTAVAAHTALTALEGGNG